MKWHEEPFQVPRALQAVMDEFERENQGGAAEGEEAVQEWKPKTFHIVPPYATHFDPVFFELRWFLLFFFWLYISYKYVDCTVAQVFRTRSDWRVMALSVCGDICNPECVTVFFLFSKYDRRMNRLKTSWFVMCPRSLSSSWKALRNCTRLARVRHTSWFKKYQEICRSEIDLLSRTLFLRFQHSQPRRSCQSCSAKVTPQECREWKSEHAEATHEEAQIFAWGHPHNSWRSCSDLYPEVLDMQAVRERLLEGSSRFNWTGLTSLVLGCSWECWDLQWHDQVTNFTVQNSRPLLQIMITRIAEE